MSMTRSMSRRSFVGLVGSVSMAGLALAGCSGGSTATDASKSASASASSSASGDDILDKIAAMSDDDVASKLYSETDTAIELSGIVNPKMDDRASIDKAWPKTAAKQGTVSVGWAEMSQANPWFVAVKNSAERTCQDYGYDLNFQIADNDVETQSSQIDDFISLGVDIIVIDPCDVSACGNDIKRAVSAGIPVVCIGSAPSKTTNAPILTTLSDNAYEVGFAAGTYAGGTFDKATEINLACVPGQLGNTSAEARVCGIVGGIIKARMQQFDCYTTDEAAKYASYLLWEDLKSQGNASMPGIGFNILAYGEGQWSEEGGLAAAEPILTANGEKLNLMVADNEFQCFGILRAIENAGLTSGENGQIKVGACADGTNQALKKIADGDMLMSGSWNGDQQGSWTIDFIKAIFEDGKDPNDLPFESFFTPKTFTKENAADWINPDSTATFFATPDFEFPQSIPEKKNA